MTYAQIDDHFDDSPKYVDYDLPEMGLLACGITYANRHLTDGVIPRGWPKKRFPKHGEKALANLIRDGRWTLRPDGNIEIVGFLDHNPSRADVMARREWKSEQKSDAGRKGGVKSGESRRSKKEADAKQNVEAERSRDEAECLKQTKRNEALSSPLLSDPINPPLPPEGVGVGEIPESDPSPPGSRTGSAYVVEIADAYAAGVSRSTGTPFGFQRQSDRVTLAAAVDTHAPKHLRGPELLAWAKHNAFRFADSTDSKFQNGYAAPRFAQWLNGGNGRPVPSAPPPRPRLAPLPKLSPPSADVLAALDAADAVMGNVRPKNDSGVTLTSVPADVPKGVSNG